MSKPRLAIIGMTACSGCQLSLLNCEDELPKLMELFEFQFFPLASSPPLLTGYYDAALVEGCITMPHEKELLLELRQRSNYLVALGSCAVCGGVAALRNSENRELLRQQVYGGNPVAMESFAPLSLQSLVKVDAAVSGCPPEKGELLKLLSGLLRGALPAITDYPVCTECRMQENLCLLTERNMLCLGPLIKGGCGARCPGLSVSCEGCRGPVPEANLKEALEMYAEKGFDCSVVLGRLQRFCPDWQI